MNVRFSHCVLVCNLYILRVKLEITVQIVGRPFYFMYNIYNRPTSGAGAFDLSAETGFRNTGNNTRLLIRRLFGLSLTDNN